MGKFFAVVALLSLWSVVSTAQTLTTPNSSGNRRGLSAGHSDVQPSDNQTDDTPTETYLGQGEEVISAHNAARCINEDGLEIVLIISPDIVDKCQLDATPGLDKEEKAMEKAWKKDKLYIAKKRVDVRTRADKDTGCYFGEEDVVKHVNGCSNSYQCGYNEGMRIPAGDTSDDFSGFGIITSTDVSGEYGITEKERCKEVMKKRIKQLAKSETPPIICRPGLDCKSKGRAQGYLDYPGIKPVIRPVQQAPPAAPAPVAAVPPPENLNLYSVDPSCTRFEGYLATAAQKMIDGSCDAVVSCMKSRAVAATCEPGCSPESCQKDFYKFCKYADAGACEVGSHFVGSSNLNSSSTDSASPISPETQRAIAAAKHALDVFKQALGPNSQDVMACGMYRLTQGGTCNPNLRGTSTYKSLDKLELWLSNPTSASPGYSAAYLKGVYNTTLNNTSSDKFFNVNDVTTNSEMKQAYQNLQQATENLAGAGFFDLIASSTKASTRGGSSSDLELYDAIPKINAYNNAHPDSPLGCLMVPNISKTSPLRANFLNALILDKTRVDHLLTAQDTLIKEGILTSKGCRTSPNGAGPKPLGNTH